MFLAITGGAIAGIVIAVVVVALILWVVSVYNTLVGLRNKVRNGWSQIDVQLKRRFDLIPNLVETVKGYATHERTSGISSAKPADSISNPPRPVTFRKPPKPRRDCPAPLRV